MAGMLVVLSAPSGCGKSTVSKRLLKRYPQLQFSVSATTRAPRAEDKEGVTYYFLTPEQFEQKKAEGAFLEYTTYVHNSYGTLWEPVRAQLEKGFDVLLEIETEGAGHVMEKHPEALSIFLMPPSVEELERRLRSRATDDDETIARRLALAEAECALASRYKYTVVNDNLARATEEICAIYERERAAHISEP